MRIVRDPPPYSPPLPPHSEYAEPLRSEYAEPFLMRTSRNENRKSQRMQQCNNTNNILKVALFEGLITGMLQCRYVTVNLKIICKFILKKFY